MVAHLVGNVPYWSIRVFIVAYDPVYEPSPLKRPPICGWTNETPPSDVDNAVGSTGSIQMQDGVAYKNYRRDL